MTVSLRLIGLSLLLGLGRVSLADESPPAAPALNLDFELLDQPVAPGLDFKAPLNLPRIEQQSKLRRKLLLAHQILGFTLLGSMTATTVLGHLNYYDQFEGGGYTQRYNIAHTSLAALSSALFATNGLLALVAPEPYKRPGRWDTARIHRIAMVGATVGMLTQIVLGPISASRIGYENQRSWAQAHLGLGYATYALTLTGALAYLF